MNSGSENAQIQPREKPSSDSYLRLFRLIFWTGMTVFFIFISIAAVFYPGGNRFDPKMSHFSLLGNFLCDLFDNTAYNGTPNRGRPYAVMGTYTLALTLLLFWNILPNLFKNHLRHQRLVRIFGTTAMATSLLIATPLHDWCINISIPLGLIAFITAIHALTKSGEKTVARLGVASFLICVINYLSLVFRVLPGTLPGLQKITLIFFLVWVTSGVLRIRHLPA